MSPSDSSSDKVDQVSRRAFLKSSSFASIIAGTPGLLAGLITTTGTAHAAMTTKTATTLTTTAPYGVDSNYSGSGAAATAVTGVMVGSDSFFASLWTSSSPVSLPSGSATVYFKAYGGETGTSSRDVWSHPLSLTGWVDSSGVFDTGCDNDDNGGTANPSNLLGSDSEEQIKVYGGTVGNPTITTILARLEVIGDVPDPVANKRTVSVRVGVMEKIDSGTVTRAWLDSKDFDIIIKRVH